MSGTAEKIVCPSCGDTVGPQQHHMAWCCCGHVAVAGSKVYLEF